MCLKVVLSQCDLALAAHRALERRPVPMGGVAGCGLVYPTRPDRLGFVRLLEGRHDPKRDQFRVRRFHVRESLYLGVLRGALLAHDHLESARDLERLAPLEDIVVRYALDVYSLSNYTLEPFTSESLACLAHVLTWRNFDTARAMIEARTPWGGLRFETDGLCIPGADGARVLVSSASYLEVLEGVRAVFVAPEARNEGAGGGYRR
jgi:hypothetical protein